MFKQHTIHLIKIQIKILFTSVHRFKHRESIGPTCVITPQSFPKIFIVYFSKAGACSFQCLLGLISPFLPVMTAELTWQVKQSVVLFLVLDVESLWRLCCSFYVTHSCKHFMFYDASMSCYICSFLGCHFSEMFPTVGWESRHQNNTF